MYEQITDLSLISSIIVGMILGMIIGFRWFFPRNIWGFIACFTLNVYAIRIDTDNLFSGSEISTPHLGLIISAILFSSLFVMNVLFIFRKLQEKVYIS